MLIYIVLKHQTEQLTCLPGLKDHRDLLLDGESHVSRNGWREVVKTALDVSEQQLDLPEQVPTRREVQTLNGLKVVSFDKCHILSVL